MSTHNQSCHLVSCQLTDESSNSNMFSFFTVTESDTETGISYSYSSGAVCHTFKFS